MFNISDASAPAWERHACRSIAYHGAPGAFAHLACMEAMPNAHARGFVTIEAAIEAVRSEEVDAAMLPCENLLAGRVPSIHLALPQSGLTIVDEHFQPIELHLAAPRETKLSAVRRVKSHPIALQQARKFISANGLAAIECATTSDAACSVSRDATGTEGVIASRFAAQLHNLDVLAENVQDAKTNVTRFYILSKHRPNMAGRAEDFISAILFTVSNEPGALVKALTGFSDAGVNLTRLESYLVNECFIATQFLCEFQGRPPMPSVAGALTRLRPHTKSVSFLGGFVSRAEGRLRALG